MILIGSITVLGMMSTIRGQVTTRYVYETMRKVHWTISLSAFYMINTLLVLLASIYFSFFSNDWFSLIYGCSACSMLATIVSPFLPESPRYLISTGQLEKAQKAFETMALVNRVASPSTIVSYERLRYLCGPQEASQQQSSQFVIEVYEVVSED